MNPNAHPNVGTVGHIDHGKPGQNDITRLLHGLDDKAKRPTRFFTARDRERVLAQESFQPSHWPPRLTRMALAVRLGTTRMLLERRP